MPLRRALLWLIAGLCWMSQAGAAPPQLLLPKSRLSPDEIAIIVNDRDPVSRRIGDYYRQARGIPRANLIHVSLPPGRATLRPARFEAIYREVQARTPPQVQAYALTWTTPFRVGCMSITTAFAAGFDRQWCSAKRCAPTRRSPYFNSTSQQPWQELGLRPTMSIAGRDFDQARALIDRGIASDASWPKGSAYLLETSDRRRSVRAPGFPFIARLFGRRLPVRLLKQDSLRDRDDVLFYFTGLPRVEGLDSLGFLPGAVADHLTSAGGILTGKRQMTVLRWLEAGATGSYGTVVEPCNLPAKFPAPGVLMAHYLGGASLVEAYWKSVAMPGEGLFVGEPLAAPFAGERLHEAKDGLLLETHALRPGHYRLLAAATPVGPFRPLPSILQVQAGQWRFRLPRVKAAYLKLEPVAAVSIHRPAP
ncbi:TIGR03790 family protein [Thiohalobacter sp. IOR34]|uniref:TIGR03790 family protein n=1 Tax=Thiohalobacter sp. IOR34 TaxID=3057176 RepID=UPI0025B24C97|nr:TIGR03790 family protein [Thiohalobacter sp. IOR34]WJW74988.1 TIGR03790 family protein [Thiohalobacter sp. IOR34]